VVGAGGTALAAELAVPLQPVATALWIAGRPIDRRKCSRDASRRLNNGDLLMNMYRMRNSRAIAFGVMILLVIFIRDVTLRGEADTGENAFVILENNALSYHQPRTAWQATEHTKVTKSPLSIQDRLIDELYSVNRPQGANYTIYRRDRYHQNRYTYQVFSSRLWVRSSIFGEASAILNIAAQGIVIAAEAAMHTPQAAAAFGISSGVLWTASRLAGMLDYSKSEWRRCRNYTFDTGWLNLGTPKTENIFVPDEIMDDSEKRKYYQTYYFLGGYSNEFDWSSSFDDIVLDSRWSASESESESWEHDLSIL